jgi:hypothetical protein
MLAGIAARPAVSRQLSDTVRRVPRVQRRRQAIARVAAGLLGLLLAAQSARVGALEVAGVEFPARIEQEPAGTLLVLNGAGVRSAFFLDFYAAALYLPSRSASAAEVIDGAGPRRIALRLLRDVGMERFTNALEDGLRGNHDEAQMRRLAPRVRQLREIMAQLGVARAETRIDLDMLPGVGLVVRIDGRARGEPIRGDDFYRALLKTWVGERPVSDELKRALLAAVD